jgi:hypothetical protein
MQTAREAGTLANMMLCALKLKMRLYSLTELTIRFSVMPFAETRPARDRPKHNLRRTFGRKRAEVNDWRQGDQEMQLIQIGLRYDILSLSDRVRAFWEDTRGQGWLATGPCRQ